MGVVGRYWHLVGRGRVPLCPRSYVNAHDNPPTTNNDVAQNVSRAQAEKPCCRPREMFFKFGSEGAFLLLCLLSELKMGLTMVKRSLPEISLLVQTTLGAL